MLFAHISVNCNFLKLLFCHWVDKILLIKNRAVNYNEHVQRNEKKLEPIPPEVELILPPHPTPILKSSKRRN